MRRRREAGRVRPGSAELDPTGRPPWAGEGRGLEDSRGLLLEGGREEG